MGKGIDIGLVSAILPERTLEEVVGFAANRGFDCVEVMCWPVGKAERRYAGVTHIDVDRLDEEAVSGIRHMLERHRIRISALGYYPNPLDPDEARSDLHIDHICRIIRAADRLGIRVVNTFVGRDPAKSVADNIKTFEKKWPPIVKVAEAHNVRIGIENCPMYFTDDEWPGGKNLATTPVIWDRLFEILPSPAFGLNYDPSHMVWQMMDPIRPVLDYGHRFHHVHLKDAILHRDRLARVGIMATPLEFHSPRIPGRGEVDWKAFFEALEGIGYRGAACIEVEDKDFEGSPEDVEKAIDLALGHIRSFVPASDRT